MARAWIRWAKRCLPFPNVKPCIVPNPRQTQPLLRRFVTEVCDHRRRRGVLLQRLESPTSRRPRTNHNRLA